MAHQVFISHSAQNREVADAICATLEKGGIRCWVAPRDVRPGRAFPGEITRAIQQSKVMLLIFSSHSNNSEQVLREVQLATDSRLPLVRFRIEDVSMNDDLKYFLSTPHWLDALTPPLSDHIARLETAIQELLGQSVEVTGKKVEADPSPPETSSAGPPAPRPPIPRELILRTEPEKVVSSSTKTDGKTIAQKSWLPWILLAVGVVVVFAGILCVIFLLALQQPEQSQKQTSTVPSQTPRKTEASPSAASPPARVAKVKQPVRQPKATPPVANTENSKEPKNESAFERAGSLRRESEAESEKKSEPANSFDRAGRGIGSIESENPKPSPDDE